MKPAEKPASKADEGDQPAVPWDEAIEKVLAERYPRTVDDLRVIQRQVEAVVAHARPAVVGIQVGDAVGSGVIVSEDGLVLTAGHVAMEPHRPVRFLFPDGRRARGVTLGLNQSIDSGMMKITDKGPWPHVEVAQPDSLKTGEWVVGLGHPNGYSRNRQPPVRIGRVLFEDNEVVSTDVSLVGGDSGGPLLNLHGEVVGIHSRIGNRLTHNFHVPISTYKLTWERLLAGEMWGGGLVAEEKVRFRPLLGVAGDPSQDRCRVTQVFPGMPADLAGVKTGDVITQLNDQPIGSFDELSKRVLDHKPGARVKLALERDGSPIELTVRLARVGLRFPGAAPVE